MAILLGFDTGGTYTDAVIFDEDNGVLASAKSLTTKADLSIGLGKALSALPEDQVREARLVSVSTTLATNALVEAHASPAALIIIGQGPEIMERSGLRELVGGGPVVYIKGGHNGQGSEQFPLDETALKSAILELAPEVDAFAVAAYFSVRNPAHENRARDMIHDLTNRTVTCSHELSSNLDAPRRALTTLINARLIPLLQSLIISVQSLMRDRDINAPLMVVRGDGSLISARSALNRPVETILSGPAASVIGASHLSGVQEGVVSDMGGTTTDVVMFSDGRPTVNRDGAMVGGWRTMVEAVNVRTYGLGGDSEVHLSTDGKGDLLLGPRRVVPLSLLAWETPEVIDVLKKQLKRPVAAAYDARFALLLRDTGYSHTDADKRPNKIEIKIIDKMREGPVPMHEIMVLGGGERVLNRLVNEGRAVIAGFTASDASHVLGHQDNWNAEAAQLGAQLFLRRIFDQGFWEVAQTAEEFSELIFERAIVESAKTVAGAVLGEHYGVEPEPRSKLARFLLETSTAPQKTSPELITMEVHLNRPLLAIGAPAKTYYGGVNGAGKRLFADLIDLPHADVANAVGAVVGSVKGTAVVLITEPDPGLFRAHSDTGIQNFASLEDASAYGEKIVMEMAQDRARTAGASETDAAFTRDDIIVDVGGGSTVFVESKLTATAHGRPDLGT